MTEALFISLQEACKRHASCIYVKSEHGYGVCSQGVQKMLSTMVERVNINYIVKKKR